MTQIAGPPPAGLARAVVPGKRARPVLRGPGRGNALRLPDAFITGWCARGGWAGNRG